MVRTTRFIGNLVTLSIKKIPNIYKIIVSDYSYLVVPDIKIFESSMKGTSITQATYVGVNVKNPTHDAKKKFRFARPNSR